MVPKAGRPASLSRVVTELGDHRLAVVALVESAVGVAEAHSLAAPPGGYPARLRRDRLRLGRGRRGRCVHRAGRPGRSGDRVAGRRPSGTAGVTVNRSERRRACGGHVPRRPGAGVRRPAMHPSGPAQPVHAGFAPSEDEITWARRIVGVGDSVAGRRPDGRSPGARTGPADPAAGALVVSTPRSEPCRSPCRPGSRRSRGARRPSRSRCCARSQPRRDSRGIGQRLRGQQIADHRHRNRGGRDHGEHHHRHHELTGRPAATTRSRPRPRQPSAGSSGSTARNSRNPRPRLFTGRQLVDGRHPGRQGRVLARLRSAAPLLDHQGAASEHPARS